MTQFELDTLKKRGLKVTVMTGPGAKLPKTHPLVPQLSTAYQGPQFAHKYGPEMKPLPSARPNKFGAVATVYDGIRFPSKAEAVYYGLLKYEREAKRIAYFLMQVPVLLPGKITYRLDFLVANNDGTVEWHEIKGKMTDVARIKLRQAEEIYGVKIKVLMKKKDKFVPWEKS